jgi:hypothetical protein
VFHQNSIEIQQEANVASTQAKIGQDLGLMDWQNVLNRFYFENDSFFDDNVGSISSFETNTFINQVQFDLSLKSQTRTRKFKVKTIFVSMLKKPRANRTMDLDRHPNHPSGHLLPIHLPSVPFATLAHFETFVMHGTPPRHEQLHHPPKELPTP